MRGTQRRTANRAYCVFRNTSICHSCPWRICSQRKASADPMISLRGFCFVWLALCLVVASLPVAAADGPDGPDRLSNPVLEGRAVALQKDLRCVVCQGQSLDQSNAPLAADLRRLIRTHIERGDTDRQIENYLVARYGDFILMKPPLELATFALWFGPLIVLLIGGAGTAVVVVRARARMRGMA